MRDLLRQLGQAVTGREGVPVTVTVDETCESPACELPTDVHVALYRIAQEALNNVVKHAQASRVAVSLECSPTSASPATGSADGGEQRWDVRLRVRDDGLGFDPSTVSCERLGIGIMHERAASIGARLEIESEPGLGTRVTVAWTSDDGQRTTDDG
jgi:signal transduction histidine kinase